ncbi:TetR/AcrR family transcriptional regulator [Sphingomonas sp. AR_OL41]|uniref:TetR/AcrR family transcriptional regulator n=1 Tax=Sphingomonas sp. AR_OL41 TaxID=3042729 RepID=UPI00248046B5|nr:TetR/AcrR family transcriptional regulator [Sphingomonas sp. AR_OL41]MDH7970945.1 TetR/AcrR family transcriptional regulator [Sphingomonas sp. AR_OL41]
MSGLAPTKRPRPKQERAQLTYELLLDVAGNLLAEVGIDRISTNMICARAGVTPPALYRYFKNKYDVLEALGLRLMARQNVVLEQWIARHIDSGIDALRDGIEELLVETAAVTRSEPGAEWILRALHATPQLVHIRLESHRYVTDQLVAAYMRHLPGVDRAALWQQLRLSVELGFAADEMLQEETRVSPDFVFAQVARLLRDDI